MNNQDFEALLSSVREAGAIRRCEAEPSRVFELEAPDIKALRDRLGHTQTELATMIGVPVATLRNWEQGRRRPRGPARALLQVVQHSPDLVVEALHASHVKVRQ